MCYVMIVYCGIGPFKEILKSDTPVYFSIAITGLIIIANFGVMIKMTVSKMQEKWRQKKHQKQMKLAQKNRKLDDPLTPSKLPLAVIGEKDEEEDLVLMSLNSRD